MHNEFPRIFVLERAKYVLQVLMHFSRQQNFVKKCFGNKRKKMNLFSLLHLPLNSYINTHVCNLYL